MTQPGIYLCCPFGTTQPLYIGISTRPLYIRILEHYTQTQSSGNTLLNEFHAYLQTHEVQWSIIETFTPETQDLSIHEELAIKIFQPRFNVAGKLIPFVHSNSCIKAYLPPLENKKEFYSYEDLIQIKNSNPTYQTLLKRTREKGKYGF